MTTPILMPALSPTMESGLLVRWIKKPGETVKFGEPLVEIESDKAIVEVEAMDEGVLDSILVPDGTAEVPVNQVIGLLRASASPPLAAAAAPPEAGLGQGQPVPAEAAAAAVVAAAVPAPASVSDEQQDAASASKAPARVFASPLARRLALEGGVELAGIEGSGPGGRIIRKDIEACIAAVPPAATSAPPGRPVGATEEEVAAQFQPGRFRRVPMDGMRRTIAARLSLSKQTIPHFYLSVECEMDALLTLRQQANESAGLGADGQPAYRLSINDFVIRAHALALQRHPQANRVWAHDYLLEMAHADVGVAVAVDGGLFTPVLREAERKSLRTLSAEIKDLAARARARRLPADECTGAASSVSNLGMAGITRFQAIINPPQSSILAVGAVVPRVVPAGDAFAVARIMEVTLSCDHRVLDGALGAALLAEFKRLIENPTTLLV